MGSNTLKGFVIKTIKLKSTKHPEALLLSMVVTILIITGFQVYWLKENYNREKKLLDVRAQSLFHETVRQVQDSLVQQKLFQIEAGDSSSATGLKIRTAGRTLKTDLHEEVNPVRIINLIGQKVLSDSLNKINKTKRKFFISLDEEGRYKRADSVLKTERESYTKEYNDVLVLNGGKKNQDKTMLSDTGKGSESPDKKIEFSESVNGDSDQVSRVRTIFFNNEKGDQFTFRLDSLFFDSIPLPVLKAAFSKALHGEKLELPFSIIRTAEEGFLDEEDFVRRPMTGQFAGYQLQLGNTFPYLLKEILLPILFSFFLVGITVFSFIILYRSLLRQYQLGQIKNDLISNISHELKTPIATVTVAVEALRNFSAGQNPEKTREYLDIAGAELQRLGLLVDNVLKISLLENKRIELKKESFNIRELLQEVLSILKLQFEKHHAQVSVNIVGDNFVIEADRLHITSVIYNLLDNALKYSQDNPVIDVQLSSLPNDIIELKVRDNGIGISKEYQAKIFDKFFRVPTGNIHNIKGYGLGLSYVKEILMAHMGFISVESEPGKGSTFSVILPFKEAPIIYFDE